MIYKVKREAVEKVVLTGSIAVVGDPMVPAAAFRSPTQADTMKRSTGGALDAFSMSWEQADNQAPGRPKATAARHQRLHRYRNSGQR